MAGLAGLASPGVIVGSIVMSVRMTGHLAMAIRNGLSRLKPRVLMVKSGCSLYLMVASSS